MSTHNQREITFAQAIHEASDQSLARDKNVFIIGLGVDDPKGIFGTTTDLHKKYGSDRVFDVPCSENALTGILLGAATRGKRPILTHQRLDFALLSLDQVINNLAKWHYMFGGKLKAPVVIRMIIGRGWGQGPQHSQSLQALFAHIPGLKVVMPATAHDAKGLLAAAIQDDNPVIYLEHRWLHGIKGPVEQEFFTEPLGKAKVVKSGSDVTIVASSYMVFESFRAAESLERKGVSVDLIDLRTIRPLDTETILKSVKRTGRLVVADTGHQSFGVSAEIVAMVTERAFGFLKAPPARVASPDHPCPTSPALSRHYYPRSSDIVSTIARMLEAEDKLMDSVSSLRGIEEKIPADVPDLNFSGPF